MATLENTPARTSSIPSFLVRTSQHEMARMMNRLWSAKVEAQDIVKPCARICRIAWPYNLKCTINAAFCTIKAFLQYVHLHRPPDHSYWMARSLASASHINMGALLSRVSLPSWNYIWHQTLQVMILKMVDASRKCISECHILELGGPTPSVLYW